RERPVAAAAEADRGTSSVSTLWRRRLTVRRLWRWAIGVVLVMACHGLAACQAPVVPADGARSHPVSSPAGGQLAGRVLLVCNASTKPCPAVAHYRTVQAAVDIESPR